MKNFQEKIYAYVNGFKIRLMDNVNGIYQLKEIFVEESYGNFDFKEKKVIDIGGFIGISAIYFLLRGAKEVIVYEINEEAYNILKENIMINKLENKITAFNIGISNKAKTSYLKIGETKGATSIYDIQGNDDDFQIKREVNLISLSSVLKTPIDILKIDCEGCEYEILNNILENKLIHLINEGIIMEAHYLDETLNPTYAKKLLKAIGFSKIISERKTNNLEFIYSIK